MTYLEYRSRKPDKRPSYLVRIGEEQVKLRPKSCRYDVQSRFKGAQHFFKHQLCAWKKLESLSLTWSRHQVILSLLKKRQGKHNRGHILFLSLGILGWFTYPRRRIWVTFPEGYHFLCLCSGATSHRHESVSNKYTHMLSATKLHRFSAEVHTVGLAAH